MKREFHVGRFSLCVRDTDTSLEILGFPTLWSFSYFLFSLLWRKSASWITWRLNEAWAVPLSRKHIPHSLAYTQQFSLEDFKRYSPLSSLCLTCQCGFWVLSLATTPAKLLLLRKIWNILKKKERRRKFSINFNFCCLPREEEGKGEK